MDLTRLKSKPVEWLRTGPDGDVALSSRVSLRRNIDAYPFVGRCSDQQKARVEELLRHALLSLDACPPLNYVRLDGLPALQRQLLAERRLISHENAGADRVRAVAFDEAERVSFVVNDKDHLLIRTVLSGMRLRAAAARADRLDDALGGRIPFAFSSRRGYLTAGPADCGTAMRAAVLLHLPALVMSHEMDGVTDLLRAHNVRMGGLHLDGLYGAGDIYQVSNIVTLGPTEGEIVATVSKVARKIIEMERTARSALCSRHSAELVRRVSRAGDLLAEALALTSAETLRLLSQLRMAVQMEVVPGPSLQIINELLLLTLPAHLQTMEGGPMDTSVRNEKRAGYVRNKLAEG